MRSNEYWYAQNHTRRTDWRQGLTAWQTVNIAQFHNLENALRLQTQ